MAILQNYPCQFSLAMVFLHLIILSVVSYKQLQFFGLQGDILNHKDFAQALRNSLVREVFLQIVIVLLFWLHDEFYLMIFNIPYLIFNAWKLNSLLDLKAAQAGVSQPGFKKSTERQILHGYIFHGVTAACSLINFIYTLHTEHPDGPDHYKEMYGRRPRA